MVTNRKLDIVIARYKENIDWLYNINIIDKKFVYNKFYKEDIYLPNIGREGHTYLYHIYHNYDNLSNYTIFTQGDPITHCNNFINICNNLEVNNLNKESFIHFGLSVQEGVNSISYSNHPNGLPMYYFFDLLFDKKLLPDTLLNINYASIFLVSKEKILHRPRNFYKFLLQLVSSENDPIEGYILERLWTYIFDSSINISNKYTKFICDAWLFKRSMYHIYMMNHFTPMYFCLVLCAIIGITKGLETIKQTRKGLIPGATPSHNLFYFLFLDKP